MITMIETAPVKSRLMYSIQPCSSAAPWGTRWPGEQLGQSGQPSPDWVRRTAPPVTMIAASSRQATKVILRYAAGLSRGMRREAGRGGRTAAAYATPGVLSERGARAVAFPSPWNRARPTPRAAQIAGGSGAGAPGDASHW